MRNVCPAGLLALASALFAPAALAQGESEFSLGVGYTRMEFEGATILVDDRDGVHLDPYVSFAPFQGLPQLRLGGAVGFSFAVDDVRGALVSDDSGGTLFVSGDDVSLMLFEPELRIAWRQALAKDEAFFVEAGVGGGAVIGWLSAGDGEGGADGAGDAELDETEATWMGRGFVRLGAHVTSGIVGIEGSYLRGGRLDFTDGAAGDVSEFYVGIFGALTF
jgi:hypothetical protein